MRRPDTVTILDKNHISSGKTHKIQTQEIQVGNLNRLALHVVHCEQNY